MTPTKLKLRRDRFLELVQAFPLKAIRNEAQHSRAVLILAQLCGKPRRTADESAYLGTLSLLVREYEIPRSKPIPHKTVTERIRFLMQERKMSVSDLAKVVGSGPEASMILSGRRAPGKQHLRQLARHFRCPVEMLM